MEINDNVLDQVAGGKIMETKEGKFILMPPRAKEFDTKEEAEEAEKKFLKPGHGHGHGPGKFPPMRHMGPPEMNSENKSSDLGAEGLEK